eukprot:9625839-Heterocapsa_arctica.AAC.1
MCEPAGRWEDGVVSWRLAGVKPNSSGDASDAAASRENATGSASPPDVRAFARALSGSGEERERSIVST